ncbi:hypothetical protein YPPY48_0621, partial [Yersinia pestis PY-48]
MLLLIRKT